MKRFKITCAVVLINLSLGGTVLAEDEYRASAVSAPPSNSFKNGGVGPAKNIAIRVRNDGEEITVEATFIVPVLPQQAWAVLTDFDNIPNFNPGVVSSKVTGRTGNRVWVSQKAATKYGFLTFSYDSKREIDLFPYSKIQERMTSGSMRKNGRDDGACSRRRPNPHYVSCGFHSRQLDSPHGRKRFHKA